MKNYFIIIFSLTITFFSVDSDSSNISDGAILSDEEISNDSTSGTTNREDNSTASYLDNREIKYFIASVTRLNTGSCPTSLPAIIGISSRTPLTSNHNVPTSSPFSRGA